MRLSLTKDTFDKKYFKQTVRTGRYLRVWLVSVYGQLSATTRSFQSIYHSI
jgi:hypothetical protein